MPRNSDGDAWPAPPEGVDCVDSDLGDVVDHAKMTAVTLFTRPSVGGLSRWPPGGMHTPKSPLEIDGVPGDAALSQICVVGL